MPTNLPPEYYSAETAYRKASTPQEKVAALEELISTIPKHKGTDKLRADFRRRLSRLREESAKKKKGGRGDLYHVEKQGAAQIALIGLPNSGKSSLLAALTNAHPVIADFPLSTVMPVSGMMQYEDIQFQLVDLPPIGNEATDGWVSGILRTADALMIIIDLSEDTGIQAELITDQLEKWKIPFSPRSEVPGNSSPIMSKPVLLVAHKYDLPDQRKNMDNLMKKYESLFPVIGFSAATGKGRDALKKAVFSCSRVIRVYSKEPGKKADMEKPFTLPAGSTVLDLAKIIHKDFIRSLRFACIWGSAKFDGQRVQKDYVLHDKDIVEYHVK